MVNFIKSILGDRKKLSILAILVIAGTLALTVFVAQKQQEIRQRAAGEQTAFFFSTGTGCSNPVTTTSFPPRAIYTLSLCLNTNNTGVSIVNGFDVTIAKGSGITFTGISDGVDGTKLTSPYFNKMNSDGSIRFGRIDNTGVTISGTALDLGKITLTTATSGTGNISMTNAQVVSPTSPTTELSVAKPILPYTIAVTNTPTPVPSTPTSTAISPQGPCYPLGDANVDGKVDVVDALLILRFVAALSITGTFNQQNADVDRDGKITSVDALKIERYVAGLDTTFSGCGINPPTPTPTTRPTATPIPTVPPTLTPTPTPRPTSTPTPTPTTAPINTADINRDGVVDLLDFNLWLRAFQKIDNPPYTANNKPYYPDVISDAIIDLLDFNAWLRAFKTQ